MAIVKNENIPVEMMYPLVERRELIGKRIGARNITVGEVKVLPGGEIPMHMHKVEDCIILRDGKGKMTIDGVIYDIKAPCSVLIPARVKHGLKNTGKRPMVIFFAFPTINLDRELC